MTGRCGTYAGYQWHRRNGETTCADCRAAAAADRRRRVAYAYLSRGQKLMVDSTGTRRRIQALVRVGWPLSEMADRLGVSFQNVYDFTVRDLVRRSTAEKIAALFDELSMLPGPSSSASKRAASKGWPPPLAWDDATIDDPTATPATAVDSDDVDELAVDAVLDGHRIALTGATAHAAVHALHARKVPSAVIAERIGIQERQVERLKARDTAPHRKNQPLLGGNSVSDA